MCHEASQPESSAACSSSSSSSLAEKQEHTQAGDDAASERSSPVTNHLRGSSSGCKQSASSAQKPPLLTSMVVKELLLLQHQSGSWYVKQARVASLRAALRQAPASQRAGLLFQLAAALQDADQREAAARHYQLCINSSRSHKLSAWALYAAAKLAYDSREYQKALDLASQGLSHRVSPEFPCLLGWTSLKMGSARLAVYWATLAASLGCGQRPCASSTEPSLAQNTFAFLDISSWYEGPFELLRVAHRQRANLAGVATASQDLTAAIAKRTAALAVGVGPWAVEMQAVALQTFSSEVGYQVCMNR
jgi:tetratricopeptide (TPR) repeat protein